MSGLSKATGYTPTSYVSSTAVPGVSLATRQPGAEHAITGLVAGEALAAGDCCYIKGADGAVWRSIGTSANAAAQVDGWAAENCGAGEALTLYKHVNLNYGSGLTPGTSYYVSGSVAGGIDTAPSTGGVLPVARSVDATRLFVMTSYPLGGSAELAALAAAIPTIAVPDLADPAAITSVPGSFADAAAVQTYLAGTNVVPLIESRLENLEDKVNALLAVLRTAGIVTP